MVIDRAIRHTTPAPAVPSGALAGEARPIIARVRSGACDAYLAPLRAIEIDGSGRRAVLSAIDARSRLLIRGL